MTLVQKGSESWANADSSCSSHDRTRHDILASLSIAKGFSSALEDSYGEMLASCQDIVDSMDAGVSEDALNQLKKYEMDCKFCITRLVRAIEQLKSRLEYVDGKEDSISSESSGELE